VIDTISDPELLKYDIVAMPGLLNSTLANDLIRMAEERGDALAIVDLDGGYRKSYENSSTNGTEVLGDHKQAITNAQARDYDTSYAATYYPPVRLRDTAGPANDVTVVHPSVAAIGALAFSEANSDGPWFAPAGFNRGGISVLGGSAGPRVVGTLEHLTKQDRDDLYEENINPIARFPAVGEIVIFGQKTLQQTPSALDRINVRRLMIYLKKKIGEIADTILFDQNVNTTWNRFRAQARRVLSDVQARFGITEFKLVLDETTTTADLVDRNILYAKIFVKPARAIEFIAIDFVITRSGIEL
jgi:phage tail sheath protein FI